MTVETPFRIRLFLTVEILSCSSRSPFVDVEDRLGYFVPVEALP